MISHANHESSLTLMLEKKCLLYFRSVLDEGMYYFTSDLFPHFLDPASLHVQLPHHHFIHNQLPPPPLPRCFLLTMHLFINVVSPVSGYVVLDDMPLIYDNSAIRLAIALYIKCN